MKFINPQVFYWLIPLIPLVVFLIWHAVARRRRELAALLGSAAGSRLAVRLSPGARKLRLILLFAAMAALLAAASRPYWSSRLLPTAERGRDVVVIFDVSKSMLARDLAPSRLEHAKFILRQLASRIAGDRLALVAFAGRAYLACPLTADPVAFDEYVNELTPDLVPVGGTNLELALREAEKVFQSAGGERAIVLLTDGDELTGNSAGFISELKKSKIPLLVIGLGDPAAPAPLPDAEGNLRRDAAGKFITSALNEPALRKLALETGGLYVRSTVTDTGVDAVAARISALDAAFRGDRKRVMPEEKFPGFLILAAVCLLLSLLISERPARKLALLAVAVLLGANASAAESEPPPAPEAPMEMRLPAQESPEKPQSALELYNSARASQEAGDFETARTRYEEVLRHLPPEERLRTKSLFNLGVDEHRSARGGLEAAIGSVRQQQLDEALKTLEGAAAGFEAAQELYSRSLSGPEAAAVENEAVADLQLLELDRKKLEELKKKIEDLKKQQQKARQSAENARQQNQQNQQNQQDQQSQQDQQDKQDQQNQSQQNQQDKQDQQATTREAREQSAKLREQARELEQKELEERARKAEEELKQAEEEQRKNNREEAQRHLDNAVRELGGGEDDSSSKPEKDSGREADKPSEKPEDGNEKPEKDKQPGTDKLPPQPRPEAADKPEDNQSARQLLQMLNDEEKARRGELHRRGRMQRPPVEKDW